VHYPCEYRYLRRRYTCCDRRLKLSKFIPASYSLGNDRKWIAPHGSTAARILNSGVYVELANMKMLNGAALNGLRLILDEPRQEQSRRWPRAQVLITGTRGQHRWRDQLGRMEIDLSILLQFPVSRRL
jgi:hypothetical protein